MNRMLCRVMHAVAWTSALSRTPFARRWSAACLVICVSVGWVSSASAARSLTFEERVAAQRAIEQVYWNHRIWPAENPGPKPGLDAVLPDAQLRAKVTEYLKKSNALETIWQRPITAEQLQAEMDRMAAHTRDGRVLDELFDALGNDPRLIAETLARQTLVERLIRNWYAFDFRFHGESKERAEAALAACGTDACMKSMGGDYREARLKLRTDEWDATERSDGTPDLFLEDKEWRDYLERLGKKFGAEPGSIPIGAMSGLEETQDAFSVTSVLSLSEGEITTAAVVWPKATFESWWSAKRDSHSSDLLEPAAPYTLPALALSRCSNDAWSPSRFEAPDPREQHSAVWTGTEMIVWGGELWYLLNTGGRYNPSTDTWTLTSTGANVPSPRYAHTATWTGTKMIVWGGFYGGYGISSGGVYDPSSDAWTSTWNGAGVPAGRYRHTAVWTGTAMIVWGGNGGSALNTGGRYDPSANTWTPTSVGANVPSARSAHTAVWTGAVMIVWGGIGASALNTGGRYDPAADTWAATSTGANLPSARYYHTAVWTGSRVIVWGGTSGSSTANTGGSYDPSGDAWTATSTGANVPSARQNHSAVWTGTRMIVWGGAGPGYANTGGRYDLASDSWASTATGANVPTARAYHTAVWTGVEMIVWGGGSGLNTGGRYDPATDAWMATSTGATVPSARSYQTAVWTGAEMVVWGGFDGAAYLGTGGRYAPSTDSWTPTSKGGDAPTARDYHTAVWTGTRMIIWGGYDGSSRLNTGGRYDPLSDTWTATATGANVPSARQNHTAVWAGSQMIVWGGNGVPSRLNTGGRYDPSTDAWMATSTGANVPPARVSHTAVWTGTRMIVWGGTTGYPSDNSGGLYDPTSDAWTPTSTGAIAPAARYGHTAVWTGNQMIVWGGTTGSSYFNSGGLYDPPSDSWTATSTGANVPSARNEHSATWTGSSMIVWGGVAGTYFNSGGRYDPSTDTWTATSTGTNVPSARSKHTSVWTGTTMIVWGGRYPTASGALYCACPNGRLYYRDGDGDSYGDPGVSIPNCDGSVPSGYVADSTDCDDSDLSVNPGAVELCDGADDDCDALIDEENPGGGLVCQTGELGVCAAGTTACSSGSIVCNRSVQPSPEECDGLDNDCDGADDEENPGGGLACQTGEPGVCAAGTTACSAGSIVCNRNVQPSPTDSICDGIDEDCNGETDEDFPSSDITCGIGACMRGGTRVCENGAQRDDCTEGSPLAPTDETCDGVDDDCNGQNDEDYAGPSVFCGIGACMREGWRVCVNGVEQDDCTPGPPLAPTDETCDGVDDDCNGQNDEEFVAYVTYCGIGGCARTGMMGCLSGGLSDTCLPGPPTDETCNGIDDDCDSVVDNPPAPSGRPEISLGKPAPGSTTTVLSWGAVAAATGYDIVRGSLTDLRAGGDYTVATDRCMRNDLAETTFEDAEVPSEAQHFWYLARAANCGGAGSYDGTSPQQHASRDVGIDGSGGACP